jgi:hypothetical protein
MDLLALPRNHSNTHANALGRTSTIDTLFSSDERHGDKLACILATYSWTWQLNTEEHRGYLYTRTCHGVHHHGGLRAMIRRTRTTTPGATCSFGRCGFHHANWRHAHHYSNSRLSHNHCMPSLDPNPETAVMHTTTTHTQTHMPWTLRVVVYF